MAAVTLVEFLHLIWSLGAQPYVESESGIKRYEEENRETEADRERHTHTEGLFEYLVELNFKLIASKLWFGMALSTVWVSIFIIILLGFILDFLLVLGGYMSNICQIIV